MPAVHDSAIALIRAKAASTAAKPASGSAQAADIAALCSCGRVEPRSRRASPVNGIILPTCRGQAPAGHIVSPRCNAARRGVPEVIAAFNHERSDFARLPDEDFRNLLARVLAKAKELDTPPKQATEEGLTTGHVTTLEARLNAFRAVITRPEDLQKHESALRQLIDAEFARIDILLDLRLDKLLRELSETHPALYADYQSARVIYDAATRSREEAPTATSAKPAGGG